VFTGRDRCGPVVAYVKRRAQQLAAVSVVVGGSIVGRRSATAGDVELPESGEGKGEGESADQGNSGEEANDADEPGEGAEGGTTSPAAEVQSILSELGRGSSSRIRVVDSQSSLDALYAELTPEGEAVTWENYKGTVVQRSDGTEIGYRSSSRSGGAAIDINFPDGRSWKVHVDG
jgi:hypothetical protein